MRKSLALVFSVAVALLVAPAANAAPATVFQNTSSPLSCALDGPFTYCGNPLNSPPATITSVASFDGTPLDAVVALPASPRPSAGYPVVGLYHGWGGNKINLKTDNMAQLLLSKGFAVFSMTDRGWSGSCGGPALPVGGASKSWPCTQGYIHLMHNAYEVRDAQYLLGQLADDKDGADPLIDPLKIGASGGSYGGGISQALAMLKDRIQLPNGQLVDWKSPQNKSMSIAGATPQYTWSDLAGTLVPNGSTLDYAAYNPYNGPNGDRRTGIPKQQWIFNLYASGAQAGYYAPIVGTGYPDPSANIIGWYQMLMTGGPFDGNSTVGDALTEIRNNHSSYYIPINNSTHTPAPMLISGSWNDDLFPFNEAIRLYNKVRTDAPSVDVSLWGVDIGHTPRANNLSAVQAADGGPLLLTQVTWLERHVAGAATPYAPPTPAGYNEDGGAVATSSKCGTGPGANQQRVAGDITTGASWAAMTQGEVDVSGAAEQTIEPGTTPADTFESNTSGPSGNGSGTDVCDYAGRTDDTEGAAVYKSDPAGSGGYTLLGSPTVDATMNVKGANDQIVARLYDYDPAGVGHQRLIARGIYRPVGVGAGPTHQTFQLYAQNYKVDAGHTLKLELLSADMPFALISKNTPQQPIEVTNLKLQVPVSDAPGAAGGQVDYVTPKTLPAGYQMSPDALASDIVAPVTTDNVPGALRKSVIVTLDAVDRGVSGVKKTYYLIDNPAVTTSSPVYDPNNKPVLGDGQTISYRSEDNAGNLEVVRTSLPAQVDSVPPADPVAVTVPPAKTTDTNATIAFTMPTGLGESSACSLDGSPTVGCSSPASYTNLGVGDHTFVVYAIDSVGNTSNPLIVKWTVGGTLSASVKITGKAKVGQKIKATASATAGGAAVPGVTYTYSWSANGKKISSKSSLKLSAKRKGSKIAVKVTASKPGYTSSTVKKTATSKLK